MGRGGPHRAERLEVRPEALDDLLGLEERGEEQHGDLALVLGGGARALEQAGEELVPLALRQRVLCNDRHHAGHADPHEVRWLGGDRLEQRRLERLLRRGVELGPVRADAAAHQHSGVLPHVWALRVAQPLCELDDELRRLHRAAERRLGGSHRVGLQQLP